MKFREQTVPQRQIDPFSDRILGEKSGKSAVKFKTHLNF